MRTLTTTALRLLAASWPAMLAWYLGSTLAHYLLIEVAGQLGAYSALAGLAVMPLAILSRLIGFVGMLLVVRVHLRHLSARAPLPESRPARRKAFVDALLGGILPFFAFYSAWKFLQSDMADYVSKALSVQSVLWLESITTGVEPITQGTLDELFFEPITVVLIVISFLGRLAWKKYEDRLPRVLALVAVYLEAMWVFLTVTLLDGLIGGVSKWVADRQAMVWLTDFRAWVGQHLSFIGWLWDGVEWLLGQVGGIVLAPIAWLTIAGVIFGQAVAAQAPEFGHPALERARARYGTLPQRIRTRLGDLGAQVVDVFRPIGKALVLMWRAGPSLIGAYILLYTVVVIAVQGWLQLALTRWIGPNQLMPDWRLMWSVMMLLIPMLFEPLRIAVVSAAYDQTINRLPPAADSDAGSNLDQEAQELGHGSGHNDLELEGSGRVEGHHEAGPG